MGLIGRHIRTAYAEPRQRRGARGDDARRDPAGMAFSNASVALVHGMCRPIGAHFHVPHGLSNAMLLPAITAFSARRALGRYAEAARRIGVAEERDGDAVGRGEAGRRELRALNKELARAEPRGLRHRRSGLERQDGADGRAGAGVGQPGQQPARARQGARSSSCTGPPTAAERRRRGLPPGRRASRPTSPAGQPPAAAGRPHTLGHDARRGRRAPPDPPVRNPLRDHRLAARFGRADEPAHRLPAMRLEGQAFDERAVELEAGEGQAVQPRAAVARARHRPAAPGSRPAAAAAACGATGSRPAPALSLVSSSATCAARGRGGRAPGAARIGGRAAAAAPAAG